MCFWGLMNTGDPTPPPLEQGWRLCPSIQIIGNGAKNPPGQKEKSGSLPAADFVQLARGAGLRVVRPQGMVQVFRGRLEGGPRVVLFTDGL